MSGKKVFEVIGSVTAPRLGRLSFPARCPISTPSFTAITSRGAVPHVTPDNLTRHVSAESAHMALEDCQYYTHEPVSQPVHEISSLIELIYLDVESKSTPILNTPAGDRRPLHNFTALPSHVTTILAPRRCVAVTAPVGNSSKHLTIFTSHGFFNLTVTDFISTVSTLRPDVIIPLADLPHTSTKPALKKLNRMIRRTEDWLYQFFKALDPGQLQDLGISVFAPVLPVEHSLQSDYLERLDQDVASSLSGLAIYDVDLLPDLSEYENLHALPKLSLDPPATPQEVLRHISLGVDLCILPFLNSISDAGVALDFTFPPPQAEAVIPLGADMWASDNQTLLEPLRKGCQCYACTSHHKAYLQHLLNAKEMLGWTLLQIHNYQVVSDFFSGVREAIGKSAEAFEEARQAFVAAYDPELPTGTGDRPRARGYHFKSEGGDAKINKPAWKNLDSEANPAALFPGQAENVLETPLTPQEDAPSLEKQGFGNIHHQ